MNMRNMDYKILFNNKIWVNMHRTESTHFSEDYEVSTKIFINKRKSLCMYIKVMWGYVHSVVM